MSAESFPSPYSCLCLRPFSPKTGFTHPAPFFPCFNSSQVLFTANTPLSLSFLFFLYHALFLIPPPLSFCLPQPPSNSCRPPPLSEEIDWVIWLGASSARFLARGKERSGGDMTTCRNNNNIHNIGRVGMDGGMERKERDRRNGVGVGTAIYIAYTQTTCHNIVSPFLSVSICLSISLPPHPPPPRTSSVCACVVF